MIYFILSNIEVSLKYKNEIEEKWRVSFVIKNRDDRHTHIRLNTHISEKKLKLTNKLFYL